MALLIFRLSEIMVKLMGKITMIVVPIVALIELFTSMLTTLASRLADFVAENIGFDNLSYQSIGEVASLVNHIFPLGEFVAMAIAYFALFSLFHLFRWVKQFIPTVSN